MKPTTELFLAQAEPLVADIKLLLAGKHPAVICAVLAELVTVQFADMRHELRSSVCNEFFRVVEEMTLERQRRFFTGDSPRSGGNKQSYTVSSEPEFW